MTGGASAPRSPDPSLKRVAKYGSSGGEKPKAILCASSKEVLQPHQSDQKTALSRIGRASQITQLVYSLESGLDVIVNVPLAPDVVDALNATARKQGLSSPAWIAMTVENALQQQ